MDKVAIVNRPLGLKTSMIIRTELEATTSELGSVFFPQK